MCPRGIHAATAKNKVGLAKNCLGACKDLERHPVTCLRLFYLQSVDRQPYCMFTGLTKSSLMVG